jgi:hypothetical protein
MQGVKPARVVQYITYGTLEKQMSLLPRLPWVETVAAKSDAKDHYKLSLMNVSNRKLMH